jgi:hypothetical protein
MVTLYGDPADTALLMAEVLNWGLEVVSMCDRNNTCLPGLLACLTGDSAQAAQQQQEEQEERQPQAEQPVQQAVAAKELLRQPQRLASGRTGSSFSRHTGSGLHPSTALGVMTAQHSTTARQGGQLAAMVVADAAQGPPAAAPAAGAPLPLQQHASTATMASCSTNGGGEDSGEQQTPWWVPLPKRANNHTRKRAAAKGQQPSQVRQPARKTRAKAGELPDSGPAGGGMAASSLWVPPLHPLQVAGSGARALLLRRKGGARAGGRGLGCLPGPGLWAA